MSVLKSIDIRIEKLVNILITIAMLLILFIVFIQVIARFFRFSIGGFEEFPTYMMLVSTWLTAAIAVKKKDHISLNLVAVFVKDTKKLKSLEIFTTIITCISFAIFSILAFDCVIYNLSKGYATPGLRIPYWILIGIMMFSSTLMTIYNANNIIKDVKETKTWK